MVDQEPKSFFIVQSLNMRHERIVKKIPFNKMPERFRNHPWVRGVLDSIREGVDPSRPICAIILEGREPVRVLSLQTRNLIPIPSWQEVCW